MLWPQPALTAGKLKQESDTTSEFVKLEPEKNHLWTIKLAH